MNLMKNIRGFSSVSIKSEFFPAISKIKFEGHKSSDPLSFRYYDPNQIIRGKTMKDWCRFSVAYWHTFRGTGLDIFGSPTLERTWDNIGGDVEAARDRVYAAFEFFKKLGVEYYCFHDTDVAPEGKNLRESQKNFNIIADELEKLQKKTGIKLLWGTANMFSHPRFMNGASTNPDFDVFAYSAAKVKHAMDITKRLGGEGYTFWGGREGYFSLLNTNLKKELDNAGSFFNMAVKYKQKIGANFQMYIEPKPREPTKHQYDYDAQTVIAFLKHYNIEKHYKLNIEPNHTTLAGHEFEHDIMIASAYGMLGSIDANSGDPLCGWDTDQFNMDVKKAALIMWTVIKQGGLKPGGLNFDCKVRRESTDLQDIFISHISAMDVYAQGLIAADKIIKDGTLPKMLEERYSSYNSKIATKIDNGNSSFEELERYAIQNDEPKQKSGQQELYETIFNRFVNW